jgi:GT2 family glycosyltransferase
MKVSVHIVTFNSGGDIAGCLDSLRTQTFRDFQVRILDNASRDNTLREIERLGIPVTRSATNLGFAAAHNALIRDSDSEYVLVLNPDANLREAFLEEIIRALDARPDAGSASGKLLRLDGITIDSTGIVMLRSQRHLDRGADQPDIGQFDKSEDIFGPSGAAALYRRTALEDAAINGQYFDEDFFAYREDADLAWRLRLLGWKSVYVPSAVALHRRRVTPERRSQLPHLINYHSVKNRFLLRINNMSGSLYRRDFWRITGRDAIVIGYVCIREWTSMPALGYVLRHLPRLWRKRRLIQSKARVSCDEVSRWFT